MYDKCSCLECKKVFSNKGIHTHLMRTHDNIGFTGSTGRNNSYEKSNYKESIRKGRQKHQNEMLGPITEYAIRCSKCDKEFSVFERKNLFPKKEKYYCSRSCANTRQLTEKTKEKLRQANTGKTYISRRNLKNYVCKGCGLDIQGVNRRLYCSPICKKYYQKIKSKSSELQKYRLDCKFNFNLKDYPEEFDFSLIEEYGWYKPINRGNNLKGISRDHMISVRYGFDHMIPPEYIKHPANCKLMVHSDNISKNSKCDFSYDELLKRISLWDQKYYRNLLRCR